MQPADSTMSRVVGQSKDVVTGKLEGTYCAQAYCAQAYFAELA